MNGPPHAPETLTGFLQEATTDASLQNDEQVKRHGAVIKCENYHLMSLLLCMDSCALP